MTTNVVPLPFQGDLIDYLKLNGHEIAWLWRDTKSFVAVRPICEIIGVSYPRQYRTLTAPDFEGRVALWATPDARGHRQEMLCLAYEDLFPWLMGITVSRVKPEAQEPLRRLRDEIKLVLAAHYHDRLFGEGRAAVTQLQAFMSDYVAMQRIRVRVRDAVAGGWTWQILVQNCPSYTQKRLVATIKDLLRIGAIPHPPEGSPLGDGEPRQLSLFGEG